MRTPPQCIKHDSPMHACKGCKHRAPVKAAFLETQQGQLAGALCHAGIRSVEPAMCSRDGLLGRCSAQFHAGILAVGLPRVLCLRRPKWHRYNSAQLQAAPINDVKMAQVLV